MILSTVIWRTLAPLASGSVAFVAVLLLGSSALANNVVEFDAARSAQDCAITASCEVSSPTAPASAVWGAVAVSNSRLLVGVSRGHQNQQEADSVALAGCRRSTNGAHDCRIVGSFSKGCVALASSQMDLAWGFSGTLNDARQADDAAQDLCQRDGGRSCLVVSHFCSTD
jgi:hypothetical protein